MFGVVLNVVIFGMIVVVFCDNFWFFLGFVEEGNFWIIYLCSIDVIKLYVDYMNKNWKCVFNYKISMIIVSVVWLMMVRMKKYILF